MSDAPAPAGPGKRAELAQLTGVRGIAAAWVVLYHFQPQIFALAPELRPLGVVLRGGYFAVDLFFLLSGYIIAYQYLHAFPRGRGDYGAFLVKRIARIYPLQLVTLVLIVILVVGGIALWVLWPVLQPVLITLSQGFAPAAGAIALGLCAWIVLGGRPSAAAGAVT